MRYRRGGGVGSNTHIINPALFKCEALLHGAFSARTRARARAHRYPCGHLGKDKAILRLGILRSPLSLKETSAPLPKLQLTVIQGALKKALRQIFITHYITTTPLLLHLPCLVFLCLWFFQGNSRIH